MARFWFWKKRPPTPPPTPPLSGQDETRNQVDYISQLPDAIILHILSFLSTKDAVKTSVLWRDTWTSNPHISFSMPSGSIWMVKSFMAFMDAVLLLCTAIKVKSFLFNAPYCPSLHFDDAPLCASLKSSIERWLHFAVGHNVEEVSLILHRSRHHNIYVLPQFMFRCSTLASFNVSCCCFSMVSDVNWSSLKRLCIEDSELNDDALTTVLSGSPVLEFLELKYCWGLEHIIVESRALRELVIDSHMLFRLGMLKISAPYLLKLHLLGDFYGEFRLDEVSSLVEAELNFYIDIWKPNEVNLCDHLAGLFERLHHVLSLKEARGVFLPSLECRHLMFHVAADEVPGIVKILESSPCLEKLFLKRTYYTRNLVLIGENVCHCNFDAEEVWNSAKRRIYMHLKDVEVDYDVYWFRQELILSLLKFLVQNAPCLDKIKIVSNNSN